MNVNPHEALINLLAEKQAEVMMLRAALAAQEEPKDDDANE